MIARENLCLLLFYLRAFASLCCVDCLCCLLACLFVCSFVRCFRVVMLENVNVHGRSVLLAQHTTQDFTSRGRVSALQRLTIPAVSLRRTISTGPFFLFLLICMVGFVVPLLQAGVVMDIDGFSRQIVSSFREITWRVAEFASQQEATAKAAASTDLDVSVAGM